MGIFKSSRIVPIAVADLGPIAQAVAQKLRQRGFDVHCTAISSHCQELGIHKGGLFKAVMGLKTALRMRLETVGETTRIGVSIGLLETQVVPVAIGMLVFWPALVIQSWGLVQQHKLDDEAIALIECSLRKAAEDFPRFCPQCGGAIKASARLCQGCGCELAHFVS
jgi:hypothetical protein